MKTVKFELAKILKYIGFPQGNSERVYLLSNYDKMIEGFIIKKDKAPIEITADIPTYFEVWNWLWTENKFRILLSASNQRWNEVHGIVTGINGIVPMSYHTGEESYKATDHYSNYKNPEEAIVGAIDYLVEKGFLTNTND